MGTRGLRRSAGSLLLLAVAVVGVGGVMATVMRPNDDGTPPPAGSASNDRGFAATRARARDTAGARTVFLGQSHQPLHHLAAAAQDKDRAVAARHLEAKARVEAALAQEQPGPRR